MQQLLSRKLGDNILTVTNNVLNTFLKIILKGTYSETATFYLASEFKETSINANEDGSFQ